MIKETIGLLGLHCTDKVTGFKGVITSASFDLYGCVQVALTPVAKDGDQEIKCGHWFDVNRVDVSNLRVMDVPAFEAYEGKPQNYNQGASPKMAPR